MLTQTANPLDSPSYFLFGNLSEPEPLITLRPKYGMNMTLKPQL